MKTKGIMEHECALGVQAIAHARPDYRPWEQYVTCCHCAHPLDDNPRMKDALKSHTTAAWAKGQLTILADMASDHALPTWYVEEVRRIAEGILLIPGPPLPTEKRA
jgi:hypothetical protein